MVAVQLAQVNVARLRFPVSSPRLAGFVSALDRVNRLAELSPGFVWRYEHGHEPHEAIGDQRTVVNLSVWEAYQSLHDYVYRSAHAGFVRRRGEWFEPPQAPSSALWWVPAGHRPTVDEALARLRHLRVYGPSPRAFSLRRRFDPNGRPERLLARPAQGSARRRTSSR